MLKNISKLLTGDMLKVLSDMGHGDVLILADANFPAEKTAKTTSTGKLIRCPGIDAAAIFEAFSDLFPVDFAYCDTAAAVMDLTDGDKASGMEDPEVWAVFEEILHRNYPDGKLTRMERNAFYEAANKAYCVIQTGEERLYGNLLLVKGCF